MLLAAAGCEVDVYERGPEVGGRTSRIEHGGYSFDRGPTFFMYPQILEKIFRLCSRNLHDEVELRRLDPNYRLQFATGECIDATTDVEAMAAEIARICPADATRLRQYLADNAAKFEKLRPALERPFNSHLDLAKLPLRDTIGAARPWASVDSDLSRHFSDPRIRLAFSFQSKYLGMSPFRCPSLFTILAFIEYEFGIHHPIGGCAAVTQAMHRVASAMGVRFHLGESVESLSFKGRRVTGLQTANGDSPCDALVVNGDFASTIPRLVPDHLRRKWSNRKIDRAKVSCSTFMLYLGIDGRYEELPHHTIYLAEDYASNLRANDMHVLPDDPSIYVHNPSVVDPTLAPPGKSSLYVLAPVSHDHPNIDWNAERAGFRERVLDRVGHLGLGDIRDRIETELVYTPADWAARGGLYKGATFSLAHSLDQLLSFRPRNRYEDLDGVYLVGGGTHPGSGLPVIFQSALISAGLIAEDFGLRTAPAAKGDASVRWPTLADESA
jgi:phytoene desaturase